LDKGNSPSGRGLRIMAYRAGMIGASFHVGPGEGGGTSVQCALPRSTTRFSQRAATAY
jgi:signal transduction histidine kinase